MGPPTPSAFSRRLRECTPAGVLTPLGLEYDVFGLGIVKPLGAQLADIGAAALKLILGDPVSYVGPPHNRQVDTTALRLPDRTPQPTAQAAREAKASEGENLLLRDLARLTAGPNILAIPQIVFHETDNGEQ